MRAGVGSEIEALKLELPGPRPIDSEAIGRWSGR